MFSKQVAYAIRCLVYLSHRDKPVLIRDISESTDLPQPFLAKIINTLTRKGYLDSQRGIGGGVTLKKNPESIILYDVCAAFDDPLLEKQCIIGMPECNDQSGCAFHKFWSKQKENIFQYLQNNSIESISTKLRKSKQK